MKDITNKPVVNDKNHMIKGLKKEKRKLEKELSKYIITIDTPGVKAFVDTFNIIEDARFDYIVAYTKIAKLKNDNNIKISKLKDIKINQVNEEQKINGVLGKLIALGDKSLIINSKKKIGINKEGIRNTYAYNIQLSRKIQLNDVFIDCISANIKFLYSKYEISLSKLIPNKIFKSKQDLEVSFKDLEEKIFILQKAIKNKEYFIPSQDLKALKQKMLLEKISKDIEDLQLQAINASIEDLQLEKTYTKTN